MDQSKEEKLLPDIKFEAEATTLEKEAENELSETEKKPEMKSEIDDDFADGSDSDSDLDSEYVCTVCSKKFSGFIPFKQHEKGSKHAKALLKKEREKKLRKKITGAEKVVEEDEKYLFIIKKPFSVCNPCGKQFGDAQAYRLHLASKAHKRKEIQSSILDQVRENGKINVDMLKELYESKTAADNPEDLLQDAQERIAYLNVNEENGEAADAFACRDCEKSFTGLVPYTQHLMSKTHARKVEKKQLLGKLIPGTSKGIQPSDKSETKDISHLVFEDDVLVCKLCSTSFSGPESAMIHLKSRKHSKNLEEQTRKMKRRQKAAAAKLNEASDDESEHKSDSEGVEDNELSATAVHETKESSAKENVSEGNENVDVKDKDNQILAYKSYKEYKNIMHQVIKENKDA